MEGNGKKFCLHKTYLFTYLLTHLLIALTNVLYCILHMYYNSVMYVCLLISILTTIQGVWEEKLQCTFPMISSFLKYLPYKIRWFHSIANRNLNKWIGEDEILGVRKYQLLPSTVQQVRYHTHESMWFNLPALFKLINIQSKFHCIWSKQKTQRIYTAWRQVPNSLFISS